MACSAEFPSSAGEHIHLLRLCQPWFGEDGFGSQPSPKENYDVGLTYAPSDLGDMRIVTAFDASFGCRPDGSSQGGFLVMLAPKKILETEEDFYHILDWRSLKLPRIARSSLADCEIFSRS